VRRRKFITVLGAVTVWPLVARAQQDRRRLVGVVAGFSKAEMQPQLAALRSKLSQLGWTEGRNLEIDARLGAGDYQQMTAEAGLLVGRNPDVIVTMGTPGLNAVRYHTKTVPVIFTLVADPVRMGFIDSLARPGGHTTGFTNFELSIGTKWLELIKEVSPKLARVKVINNPANPTASQMSPPMEAAGAAMSIQVSTAFVRGADDIEAAILGAAQQPGSGIIVIPDSLLVVHSELILQLVERHQLPAIYPFRLFAVRGRIAYLRSRHSADISASCGVCGPCPPWDQAFRLAGSSAEQFELIINLKTAKSLGLDVPPTLLARADEVIE